MTSNQKYSPLIEEALVELAEQGLHALGPALERPLNELMLIEREEVLQASPYERTEERKGYANGFKNKMLQTRIGKLQLKVPQTREPSFYPSCLEKGTRSERALGLAMAEMYVNGISTRRVKRITEELCGLQVSSTQALPRYSMKNLKSSAVETLEKYSTFTWMLVTRKFEKMEVSEI